MILDRKFFKYQVIDKATGREVKLPENCILDYVNDKEGMVCFKSVDSFTKRVVNPMTHEEYDVTTPVSYHVKSAEIEIISLY